MGPHGRHTNVVSEKPFYIKDIQKETRATESYELSKQNIRTNKKIKDGEMAVRQ